MTRFLIIALVAAACSRSDSASNKTATPPAEGHHEDRSEPATAAPPLSLEVKIGDTSATWNQDVFDRVSHRAGTNNSGESRDTWSLRELVHEMVGANARVFAVIGKTNETISPEAWADASRTPILHRTRRGGLKFRWTDASGKWDEAKVSDVIALEIVP